MDNQANNTFFFTPNPRPSNRRSIYDSEIPSPASAQNTYGLYKEKVEKEIADWKQILQEKYLRSKNPLPQMTASSESDPPLNLTDVQNIYLSQAPAFHQMNDKRKEFIKTIEYYLSLRSHVAEDIEYRHKLLNSVANKAVRDIINKAIYE